MNKFVTDEEKKLWMDKVGLKEEVKKNNWTSKVKRFEDIEFYTKGQTQRTPQALAEYIDKLEKLYDKGELD